MSVIKRNNVTITGQGDNVMMFAHGFGCDQNMWRYVYPAFKNAGNSDLSSYSFEKSVFIINDHPS